MNLSPKNRLMDPAFLLQLQDRLNRRTFLQRAAAGMGLAALSSLSTQGASSKTLPGEPIQPFLKFAPKAKRIIFLHQSGAPSHVDLFDYKPKLQEMRGQDLPASIRMGQ